MGKCSGLKGGGHHRRALDVAEKKKNEKSARKKEQAASGKRAVILKEILKEIDPDCDLYMDAAICDGNGTTATKNEQQQQQQQRLPDLCRAHFRHEACSNKRCKFSHEHSIAEGLSNIISGTNDVMNNNDNDHDGPQTIPALRHLPGILGNNNSHNKTKKKSCRRQTRRQRIQDEQQQQQQQQQHVPSSSSALENSVSEGIADRIVACLDADADVVSFGTTCWHLFETILEGDGCPDVQKRKYRAKERRLLRRNAMLLSNKTLAGGLRYAVSYFESSSSSSKKKKKSNSNKKPLSLRPVLVFDYENPNVYKAFLESGKRKASLESSLDENCTIGAKSN